MSFFSQWNILEFNILFTNYLLKPQIIYISSFLLFNTFILKIYTVIINLIPHLSLKTTIVNSIVITIKFIMLIALLVFVRGGIPRYRYDFLTKVGWIKFLSLILAVFLSSLLLIYLI